MKFLVKDMDIATGGVRVAILNTSDARKWDLHSMDRVLVKKGRKTVVAVLDIAESSRAVPPGHIGLFEETLAAVRAKNNDGVTIAIAPKPASLTAIRRKLDGEILSAKDLRSIVQDISSDSLSDLEVASYITANYTRGMSFQETVDLTKAMVSTGAQLSFPYKHLLDIHCIGGVPGNRTTLIVVPILVAAGLKVPKTASRAITSPAGTADTMEVLAPVALSAPKLHRALKNAGGFIVWGGAVNLAPSDDKIIKVEHPLSIDAEGQMLASIMAKKASVGATHLLMDLPIGPKLSSVAEARKLGKKFIDLGKELGMKVNIMISDGSQPIGRAIGPVLEAKDCAWILQGDSRGSADLREKSLVMAGQTLEFAGTAKRNKGYELAKKLLETGAAWIAMKRMILAQGGKEPQLATLPKPQYSFTLKATKTGKCQGYNNEVIAKAARIAGAPSDPCAGIFLHKQKGEKVLKGDSLLTLYADNVEKMAFAKTVLADIER